MSDPLSIDTVADVQGPLSRLTCNTAAVAGPLLHPSPQNPLPPQVSRIFLSAPKNPLRTRRWIITVMSRFSASLSHPLQHRTLSPWGTTGTQDRAFPVSFSPEPGRRARLRGATEGRRMGGTLKPLLNVSL